MKLVCLKWYGSTVQYLNLLRLEMFRTHWRKRIYILAVNQYLTVHDKNIKYGTSLDPIQLKLLTCHKLADFTESDNHFCNVLLAICLECFWYLRNINLSDSYRVYTMNNTIVTLFTCIIYGLALYRQVTRL